MKAMVTGGAGFIGSHLVDALLRLQIDVISIDNYSAGKRENLAHLKSNKRFQEIDCDVTDYDELKKHMKGVNIIFHNAASKKNICLKDPSRDLEVNAGGTLNILLLAKEFKIQKIVHASTGSVYGKGEQFPMTEEHPLNPVSYYGVSKLAGERYVMAFAKLYGMNVTVLRYFHVYGPRQDCGEYGGVISIFTDKILKGEPITIFGDGDQIRSFTYVKDVVDANIFVACNKDTKGQVFNCASGVKITVNEAAEHIEKAVGKQSKRKYENWLSGDVKYFDIDNTKLRYLGFEYETEFENGLKNTISYCNTPDEMFDTPFRTKYYKSYDEYTDQQKSKYNQDNPWMSKYLGKYYTFLCDLLKKSTQKGFLKIKGATSLCLGARDGTEVRAFTDLGSFCVGIDLNTGVENKYVVTGDASAIQYPDNSVDIVYTNAFDHFLKIEETINEIKRVLKPGGRLLLILGSAYDSINDKYGSTYWGDKQQVIDYLRDKHDFVPVAHVGLVGTHWFSCYAILKNKGT